MKHAIGIDLGGTNLRVALVNESGQIVKKIKEPTTADVREAIKRAVDMVGAGGIEGVGIGVAGIIDRKEKRIVASPNLHTLDGYSFNDLGLGVPVEIENDANAAALGELWQGAGRKYRNFVLLTLGTGIGCGIVYDGRLMNVPAEVGHMSVEAEGERCPCGNYGCLENYASARALREAAAKALEGREQSLLSQCCSGNIYKITPKDILESAFEGDSLSRELLKNAGKYLGVGIANLVHIMRPEAVVLTGGLVGAWDIYVEEAMRETRRRVHKSLIDDVAIMRSPLGDEDAGVIGAAGLLLYKGK